MERREAKGPPDSPNIFLTEQPDNVLVISKNNYLGARLNEVVQSVKGKNNPESF